MRGAANWGYLALRMRSGIPHRHVCLCTLRLNHQQTSRCRSIQEYRRIKGVMQ